MSRSLTLLLTVPAVALITYACGGSSSTYLPEGSAGETGAGGKGSGGKGNGSGGDGEAGSNGTGSAGSGGSGNEPITCQSDKACTVADQLCDLTRSVCVDCLTDPDCGENSECRLGECKPYTPCESSLQCGDDEVCNTGLGRCVQCNGDNDCPAANTCDANHECRPNCGSDKDCSALGQVCDLVAGHCVGCLSHVDCASSQYCDVSTNACLKDVCTAGSTQCSSDNLMTCNADGTGFGQQACPAGCVSNDGPARCGEIIAPTCEGSTANLCASLPRFTGAQTVDGDPEEFCNVPYQVMTPQNAGFISGQTGAPVTADGKTSQAIVRAAWSATFLHVHVRVVDPKIAVSAAADYNKDNVQLFYAPTAPLSGEVTSGSPLSSGAGQLFMIPGNGDLIAPTSRFVVTYTQTGYEYAARLTNDGYEVEAKIPWRTTLAANATVGFDVMVGVNDTDAGLRDYEYGLYMGPENIAGCTTATPKGLWCNAALWCTPTLAN